MAANGRFNDLCKVTPHGFDFRRDPVDPTKDPTISGQADTLHQGIVAEVSFPNGAGKKQKVKVELGKGPSGIDVEAPPHVALSEDRKGQLVGAATAGVLDTSSNCMKRLGITLPKPGG